ncbi:hypothetical protein F5141DRAFT_1068662 [Pisolithus sp. B1]|nr:hypothetical protein F5141DRAFT_1068662 [Pisolithus sp. B1]
MAKLKKKATMTTASLPAWFWLRGVPLPESDGRLAGTRGLSKASQALLVLLPPAVERVSFPFPRQGENPGSGVALQRHYSGYAAAGCTVVNAHRNVLEEERVPYGHTKD